MCDTLFIYGQHIQAFIYIVHGYSKGWYWKDCLKNMIILRLNQVYCLDFSVLQWLFQ